MPIMCHIQVWRADTPEHTKIWRERTGSLHLTSQVCGSTHNPHINTKS